MNRRATIWDRNIDQRINKHETKKESIPSEGDKKERQRNIYVDV